jgi:hypothetical protein
MTTHAGTGLFCLVRFKSLFFLEVFLRAAMYDRRFHFFRFLSVGVSSCFAQFFSGSRAGSA